MDYQPAPPRQGRATGHSTAECATIASDAPRLALGEVLSLWGKGRGKAKQKARELYQVSVLETSTNVEGSWRRLPKIDFRSAKHVIEKISVPDFCCDFAKCGHESVC